jgi:hypothetical protein
MPLVRYFLFAGGALLGLLFLADWYFPITSSAASSRDIDRTIIRIHASHRWPDAVHIDTNMPMPQPAPAPVVADNVSRANVAAAAVRETYAYVPEPARKPSGRTQRRVRATSRWVAREAQPRFASSQPNRFPLAW